MNKMKKRVLFFLLLLVILIIVVFICSDSYHPSNKLGEINDVDIHVDGYGNHTEENVNRAIKELLNSFVHGYNDCVLINVTYNADEVSDLEEEYVIQYKGEIIILEYTFESRDKPPVGITPNSKTTWKSILKSNGDQFEILSYGFE